MTRLQKQIYLALLVAVSLVIYSVELQIPSLVPIPGIKLGLSNLVSLCALLIFGPYDALVVLIFRIILGGFLTGQMMALAFSFGGGLLSMLTMIILVKYFYKTISLWVISIVGGVSHNIAQLLLASFIVENVKVFYYLPILIVSGSITGYFIGIAAHFIVEHFNKLGKIF